VDLIGADKAKREFDELLAAVWAQQVERLRRQPDLGGSQAGPDSQETTRRESDVKTLRDNGVFVACTVNVGDRVYAIRSEHGKSASPQLNEEASQNTTQKEESP